MHELWMRKALIAARKAGNADEVPIGAVVVVEGRIVGTGWNNPVGSNDPTAHAEIVALREAATAMGNYRLMNADLYCTLEPCPMCAGAIVAARIRRLVFGTRDLKAGGVRSKFQIADSPLLNHQVEVIEGVLGAECTALLRDFFGNRR